MTSLGRIAARVSDAALEASIVGSFTRAGFEARSKLNSWKQPPQMSGQTALITGGTTGIGRATALGLMALGADVIITSRSKDRADSTAAEFNEEASTGSARGLAVDTGDHDSVRELIDAVKASTDHLDVLINNAGALTNSYNADAAGTELTLSSHLIGPYILTLGLKDHMADGGRILWMSSGGMYTQGLDVETIELSAASYKGAIAYAKAKRGQVELVTHLAPRWAPGIIMHSMHPGWVDTPGVDAGLPGFGKVMGPTLRTAEQGADTMVWLAASGGNDAKPGSFFHDRSPRSTSYIPGTGTTPGERQKLVNWLDKLVAA
ncbi:MAG: SDR family NAD(P)-dependent oxidoreductase [Acidimicrobiales bacterium]